MKGIFTLFILIITSTLHAQQAKAELLSGINPQQKASYTGPSYKTEGTVWACGMIRPTDIFPNDTFLIINGVPEESKKLSQLDPNEIQSIDILKPAEGSFSVGCHSLRKLVICVATFKRIAIKDAETGEAIPMASICFTIPSGKLSIIADEDGLVSTEKLERNNRYTTTVSSAGYKTISTTVTGDTKEIVMHREIKTCEEVFVSTRQPYWICQRRSTCSKVSDCTIEKIATRDSSFKSIALFKTGMMNSLALPVYPNPVQRSNTFNIEFAAEKDEMLQLTVSGLSGTHFLLHSYKGLKGLNRFSITADARWAAGMYIIRVQNEKGVVVTNEKLVIQ